MDSISEQREIFAEQYMSTVKRNGKLITREDLELVRFLKGDAVVEISEQLKRRIKRNKWELVTFGTDDDVVVVVKPTRAVIQKDKKVCF